MARLTLSEFLNNRNLLAIKISSHDLDGFFRKTIIIPLNTTGLALFHDGTMGVMNEGQAVTGHFDLVLAKRGETQVRLVFPDLRTSDAMIISITAAMTLEIATTRLDLFRDFCRAFFNFPGTFAVQVDGSALTALQLIDDAIYTDGTGTPSKGMAVMGTDGTNPQLLSCSASGHLNITDGGNVISVDWNGTAPPIGSGTEAAALRVTLANDSTGLVSVDDNGSSLTVDGNVGLLPITSGGCSAFYSIDIDETEEEIKGSAGQVYGIVCINKSTALRYLKFYNATAANVTVGTTAPMFTIAVPSQSSANGAGFVLNLPVGIAFGTAITVAATTGAADNDTGAPGANDVLVAVFYK